MTSNLLSIAAKAYIKLIDTEYRIVLGRKNEAIELKIQFSEDQFYHLAGLHKLRKQYPFKTKAHGKVFKDIINGYISTALIQNDENYQEVTLRLAAIIKLEEILDSYDTQYYKYDIKKVRIPSRLKADFLLEGNIDGSEYVFTFLTQEEAICSCKSIFYKGTYDYALGQTKYTLLSLEKTNCSTGESAIIYSRI